MPAIVEPDPGANAARIRIKAVPGASRDGIAGILGDRLKVRVAKPPEDGRANRAICDLVAHALGVRPQSVSVVSGHASRDKTLRVEGVDEHTIRQRLGIP